MQIDKESIKALKDRTSAGLLDCRRALEEANGNIDKAIEILKAKGLVLFEKRKGRFTSEFRYFVSADNGPSPKAGLLLVLSETDFANNNKDFVDTFQAILNENVHANVKEIDQNKYAEKISLLGSQLTEHLKIEEYRFFEGNNTNDFFVYYLHKGKNLGLVHFQSANTSEKNNETALEELKKIAVHIVGTMPKFLKREEVPSSAVQALHDEIITTIDESKPQHVKEKMLEGQIEKRLNEQILLKQSFAFDEKMTVEQYIEDVNKRFESHFAIRAFFFFGNE